MKLVAPFNLHLSTDVYQALCEADGTQQSLVVAAMREAHAAGVMTAMPLPPHRLIKSTHVHLPLDCVETHGHLATRGLLSSFIEAALRRKLNLPDVATGGVK